MHDSNNIYMSGNHICLMNDKASICHDTTGIGLSGAFVDNYVEYYATRMKFATIMGNHFCHKGTGSSSGNKIILQCPTNMTGNLFTGSKTYIDGQNKTHIIDRNMYDTEVFEIGNASSNSVKTNNLQI